MVSAPPPSSCATANTTHTLARTPSGTAQRRRTRMCCGKRTAGKLHARTRLSDQRVPKSACPSARGRVAHAHAHTHPCVCTRMRIHTHACVFCPCPPFRPLSATPFRAPDPAYPSHLWKNRKSATHGQPPSPRNTDACVSSAPSTPPTLSPPSNLKVLTPARQENRQTCSEARLARSPPRQ